MLSNRITQTKEKKKSSSRYHSHLSRVNKLFSRYEFTEILISTSVLSGVSDSKGSHAKRNLNCFMSSYNILCSGVQLTSLVLS